MPQTRPPRPTEEDPATQAQPAQAEPFPQPVYITTPPASVTTPSLPAKKHDETEPGGRFYRGDKLVNSEGQRIHEDGTLLTPDELAAEA